MKRRSFIAAAMAATLAPVAGFAQMVFYKPGVVADRLAAGETVFLVFGTEWCTTCAAQERTINALLKANPAYEESITFVDVDYDVYGNSDLAIGLNIPRRSTLVVLKGDQEIGRIVAGTSKRDIQSLMDAALAAAVA